MRNRIFNAQLLFLSTPTPAFLSRTRMIGLSQVPVPQALMTSSSWLTSNKEKEKSLNVSGSAQFWRVIEYRDANYFDLPVIYTIFNPLYSHTAIGAKIMIFKKIFKSFLKIQILPPLLIVLNAPARLINLMQSTQLPAALPATVLCIYRIH